MWRAELDISELERLHAEAARELRGVRPAMHNISKRAAEHSRRNHDYINRTGETQTNTFAVTESTGGDIFSMVTIDVPHASYLMQGGTRRRTTSLTAMEDAARQAEVELEYYFDALGEGLG